MKIPSLLLLCLAALVSGKGHLYPSAPAPAHHRPLAPHGTAALQPATSYAYLQPDARPGGAASHHHHQGPFDVTHNFRKLPLTTINSFHGFPSLVPVNQDYVGFRKQQPLTPQGPLARSPFHHQHHHQQQQQQHWTYGSAIGRPQPSAPPPFGVPGSGAAVQNRPLAPSATYYHTQPQVPTAFVASAGVPASHRQPLGPSATYQSTHPLSQTYFGLHQKQPLGPSATFHGPQPLAPTYLSGHRAGTVHQRPLGPLTEPAFVAPGSVSAHHHYLATGGPSSSLSHKQPLTSGGFSSYGHNQPLTSGGPSGSLSHKQPLTSGGGFSSYAHKQPLAFQSPQSTGHATPFQKQPPAPSTAVHGQQQATLAGAKSAKGPPAPGSKKPFAFSYTANPTRKVVEVSPQRGVIAGTVPYSVLVQTASGPKYGTYHQPAALAYTYNATKVHYKPVEAHGYQVRY